MFGQSDTDRSQDQGGCREAPGMKEGGGKDTAVRTRTGGEAAMRAMSVLENAKSNGHRKTHRAEPDGTGRKFAHPPRADPSRESGGAVGRSRSREESRANPGGAKGRRMRRAKQAKTSRDVSRYERAPGEIRFPGLDAGRARGGYARGPVAGKMRRTPTADERRQGQSSSVIRPPDADNRMSGGVEGSQGAIPATPSDRGRVVRGSNKRLAAFRLAMAPKPAR